MHSECVTWLTVNASHRYVSLWIFNHTSIQLSIMFTFKFTYYIHIHIPTYAYIYYHSKVCAPSFFFLPLKAFI